jgi:predicted O-methyltransferase YrrM
MKTIAPPRPLTEIVERQLLARLAQAVPAGGLIVEIGTMYGGTTAALALAAPQARLITIDNFSWHPPDDQPSSKELVARNMAALGIENVTIIEGDSRHVGKKWPGEPIALLWVDGGHEYAEAKADLDNFGKHAEVIAVHDYILTQLPSVKQAVDDYAAEHPEFHKHEQAHSVIVLRRHE